MTRKQVLANPRNTPPIVFEKIHLEHRAELNTTLEDDIAETIRNTYAPIQCQVRDTIVITVLALFCGTLFMLAQLFVYF